MVFSDLVSQIGRGMASEWGITHKRYGISKQNWLWFRKLGPWMAAVPCMCSFIIAVAKAEKSARTRCCGMPSGCSTELIRFRQSHTRIKARSQLQHLEQCPLSVGGRRHNPVCEHVVASVWVCVCHVLCRLAVCPYMSGCQHFLANGPCLASGKLENQTWEAVGE